MSVTLPLHRDDSSRMDAASALFCRYRDRGELAALGQVFDLLSPQLLALALHLCGHAADAEDALQATFVVAMRKAADFDTSQPLAPWLAGILAGEARNVVRAEARRRTEALPDLAVDGSDPVAAAERRELVAQLRTHVDALPDEQRQAVLLQLQHGLQPAEIAEVLKVAPGTVRMRLHRGLRALRRLLPAGLAAWWFGVLPTRGLAAVRQSVMREAGTGTVATGAVVMAMTVGGVMTMKKVVAAAALVLVALAVVVVQPWSGGAGRSDAPQAVPTVTAVADAATPPLERKEVAAAAASAADAPGALRLRAVDEQGRPVAQARLCLTLTVRQTGGAGETPKIVTLPATTDDGLAVEATPMQHVPANCELVRATARIQLVGGDGPEIAVNLASPPATLIDVPVPAFGQVDVTIIGQDGEPWCVPCGNKIYVAVTGSDAAQAARDSRFNCAAGEDGHARIAFVRCNAPLTLDGFQQRQPLVAPKHQGETVRAELRFDAGAVVVAGRLLDAERKPYPGPVMARLESPHGRGSMGAALSPGKDGRFRLALNTAFTGEFVLQMCDSRDAPNGDEALLNVMLVAGRNEIGDVVMARAPLLVSGRILDPDGRPSTSVRLLFQRALTDGSLTGRGCGFSPKIAADGSFVVRTLPQSSRYSLEVLSAYLPKTVEFAPGTENLIVQLSAGTSLTATFLYDAAIEVMDIRLAPPARPTRGMVIDPLAEARLRGQLRRQGDRLRNDWHGLEPGRYRFVVSYVGIGTLLEYDLTIGDSEVTDPRLVDIDLRNRAHAFHVGVTDRDGKRLTTWAKVYEHGSAAPAAWIARAIAPDGNSVETFAAATPADVYVLADGYRGRSVHGVTSDLTLVLDPMATVTLRCAQVANLRPGVTANLVWLPATPLIGVTPSPDGLRPRPTGVESALMSYGLPETLVAGVATLRGESSMPLGLDLVLRDGKGYSQRLPMSPASLDPVAFVDGETIELSVDGAALQQALEQLGKR